MSMATGEKFKDYYVYTDNVTELKKALGSKAAENAFIELTLSGPPSGDQSPTQIVDFRVDWTNGEGAFLTRGKVVKPQHVTEASIRSDVTESGTEVLVLVAEDLDRPADGTTEVRAS